MSIAIIICMHYFDLYDTTILSNRREVLIRLTQALGTVYSLSVLVYFLLSPPRIGQRDFRYWSRTRCNAAVFLAGSILKN